jgi:hypothetical protein
MKINEAEKLLMTLLEVGVNTGHYATVRLLSAPGLGKSSVVKSAALNMSKKLGTKVGCKVVRLCEVEQPDVKGYGLPPESNRSTSKMEFSLPFWAWDKEKDGEYGFLFLDEQPQANDDVNKVAAEIMLDRRVGDYQLPPGVLVVAAGNREQDRSGARKTMAFIQNRIVDINIVPNKDALVDWMERNGIHHTIISYTEAFPADVLADKIPDKPGPFCTPRSLCLLSPYIDAMSMEMFTEFAAGSIGEGSAAKFIAHLRVVDDLPTFAEIIANPLKTKVPERSDAAYATMRMVAHNVTQENALPAFQYLARMNPEFQAAALRHSVRRTPQIVQHKEFATWLRSNKKLLEAANLLDKKDGK